MGNPKGSRRRPEPPLLSQHYNSTMRNPKGSRGRPECPLVIATIQLNYEESEGGSRGATGKPPCYRNNTTQPWEIRRGQGGRPECPLEAAQGFRLCGGDQRAFRSPFGFLRACGVCDVALRFIPSEKGQGRHASSLTLLFTLTSPDPCRCRSCRAKRRPQRARSQDPPCRWWSRMRPEFRWIRRSRP